MISALLYKELKLGTHPTVFIFLCFGAMLFIPAYPYTVTFFYGCLALFFSTMQGRENRDVFFNLLLPVTKRGTVEAKTLYFMLVETAYLAASVPFAVLHFFVSPANAAGTEPTLWFFGIGLAFFGVFNLVFLSEFYRTAYAAGKAFLCSLAAAVPILALGELLPQFPALTFLRGVSARALLSQVPFLLGGAVLFALFSFLGFRLAAKRFERVDL